MKLDARVEADSTTASGVEVGPPTVQAFVRMVKTVLLPVLVEDYVPDEDVCDYDLDKDSWMEFTPLSWNVDVSCHDCPPLIVQRNHHQQHNHHHQQQQDQSNATRRTETSSSVDDDLSLQENQPPDSSIQCDTQFTYQDLSARTLTRSSVLPTDFLSTCINLGSNYIPLSRDSAVDNIRLDVAHISNVRSYLKRKLPLSPRDSSDPCSSSTEHGLLDGVQTAKQRRFSRAAGTLDRLGLWEVAVKTGNMLLRGRQLQKELNDLKQDLRQLMLSVLRNPENENLKNALVAMKAQIHGHGQMPYEQSNLSVQS